MKKNLLRRMANDDAGVTLIEIIVCLVLSAILAVGITQLLTASTGAMDLSATAATSGNMQSNLVSYFTSDVHMSNGYTVPFSSASSAAPNVNNMCTSWDATDTSYAKVVPLVTMSVPVAEVLKSATWNGTSATYTSATTGIFVPGQIVNITDFVNVGLNLVSATIASATGNTLTVPNVTTPSGSVTEDATLYMNQNVGYEIRTVNGAGQLWRVTCAMIGANPIDALSVQLRSGLPVSSDAMWLTSIKCLSSTGATISSTDCPVNTFLNTQATYPGISLAIPATTITTPNYPSQTLIASRSMS